MVRHLDHEYELERPSASLSLLAVVDALGGWKGVIAIAIAIMAFYAYVIYAITTGRKRREAAKVAKKK